MGKFTVLIDVDQTIVDPSEMWLQHQEQYHGVPRNKELMESDYQTMGALDYNLSKYFPHCPVGNNKAFWNRKDLYDDLEPLEGAVENIEKLYKSGMGIIFVSMIFQGHYNSKIKFLKRNFPFLDLAYGEDGSGFIATQFKGAVRGDVIVDDRNEILNQFDEDVLRIKFYSTFSQSVDLKKEPDLLSNDWSIISDKILERYNDMQKWVRR